MKKVITLLLLAMAMLTGIVFAGGRPQAILGPGTGAVNFRQPYHETTDRVLSADTTYILTGWYFIDSTYSITIPPGTVIRGDSASGGTLIVKRGAKIWAYGKAAHPIVFTSNKAAGERNLGDWGGVVILGNAPTNQPTNKQIEGGFAAGTSTDASYGGPDPNDNSGVFQYVRIEYAGIAFSQDNEINGLTLGGVGAGTTIDHIQVSFANDDDFEFFGGTVRAKYLVSWRSLDDTYDADFGWSGSLQFCYTKRDPLIFDASASGSSNGFESDNEGTSPYTATPRTQPRVSNMTIVGPQNDTTTSVNSKYQYVGMLRRATEFSIYNSILMGYPRGIQIRDTLTQRAAVDNRLEIRNTSLQSLAANLLTTQGGPIAGFVVKDWFDGVGGYTATANLGSSARNVSDMGFTSALFNLDGTNDPVPGLGTEADIAGTLYQGRLAGDAWFDSVGYRGAFDPNKSRDQQWDAGWTNYDPQNYDPESAPIPVSVEFRANMKVKALEGLFNPSEDYVLVRGSFNGWGEADTLTDSNNDSIYTKTIENFNPGDTLNFKYYYRDVSASQDQWENDPNRTYVVPSNDSFYEAFFNNDEVVSLPVEVFFSCNMELERLSGRFNPAEDTVSVNGSFNGWTPKATIMTPNGLNPDIYEASYVVTVSAGDTIAFKFWYTENNWESISDRKYGITPEDVTNGFATYEAAFNNGTLETVINQACTVNFTVYMPGAVSSPSGTPFSPLNTVHIAGSALPLQWPNGGWPTADSGRMITLYDDGTNGDVTSADGIYSANITFPAYTPLQIQYKYGANFGDPANTDGNDNENGFGNNHLLNFTKFMTSVTTVDTFGQMGNSDLKYGAEVGTSVINLSSSWNMVSVPREVSNFAKNSIFPTATSNAFAFNGGYVTSDTLNNGTGYWLKFASAVAETLQGAELAISHIPVVEGWNMIGSISSSVPVGSISSNPPGLVTSQFYGYSAGYITASSIEPGKGYWVKVSGAGTLTLAEASLVNAANAIRIVPTGELPPPPPQGSSLDETPKTYSLGQNYPNPFNPATTISFSLIEEGIVSLKVFNVLGQEMVTLANQTMQPGAHQVTFDASNLTSGLYFYRIVVQDVASNAVKFANSRTMMLVK